MDVVFVGPVPPLRGGIAQHAARLIEALADLGHRVTVYSWTAQYPRLLYPGDERDRAAEPFPGAHFVLRWYDPRSWWRVGRQARGADLLVFPWVTPVQAPAYWTILRAAGRTPAVAIVHNPLPHERRFFDRLLTRLALSRVEGAVVHAQGAVEELGAVVPRVPSLVVPHPPNLRLEPTELPPAPPFRLLFVGFVRPYKGLDVALEALARLRREGLDVTLTVAGEFWGPVEPWRERIERLGIADRVTLRAEYVSDEELAGLLASHHVVVAPYRSATQSGIVPIAYAAGRPVVATRVGGLPEVVVDGETGALAPIANPGAFADAVKRTLEHLDELARGAAAVATSWRDVAEAVVDLGV